MASQLTWTQWFSAGGEAHPFRRTVDRAFGLDEAEHDLAQGILALRVCGPPTAWRARFAELVRTRLGVEVDSVGGFLPTERDVQRAAGYNAVMRAAIDARFGAGALAELEAEASRAADAPGDQRVA